MLKKLLLSLIITCSLILASSPVSALEPGDVVMSLSPSERELELDPGKTYESSVTVSNVGRLPFDIKASVSPYYVSDNDYAPDFETETSYTKLHNWITLEQTEYHLEPNSSADVHFTIKVPENVAVGGQYAAIMLLSDSGIEEDAAVKVQSQLAAIIYGHVNGGEIIRAGELVSHSLPSFMFNDKISVSQTVKNDGNVDFRVRQVMTITDYFSNQEVVNEQSIDNNGQIIGANTSAVLPGTSRTGILTWTNAPKLGLFKVSQRITFLDQEYTFEKMVFLCPLWLLAIVLIVLVAFIINLTFKVKKSLSRSKVKDETTRDL